jgi:hypothetical protein
LFYRCHLFILMLVIRRHYLKIGPNFSAVTQFGFDSTQDTFPPDVKIFEDSSNADREARFQEKTRGERSAWKLLFLLALWSRPCSQSACIASKMSVAPRLLVHFAASLSPRG